MDNVNADTVALVIKESFAFRTPQVNWKQASSVPVLPVLSGVIPALCFVWDPFVQLYSGDNKTIVKPDKRRDGDSVLKVTGAQKSGTSLLFHRTPGF